MMAICVIHILVVCKARLQFAFERALILHGQPRASLLFWASSCLPTTGVACLQPALPICSATLSFCGLAPLPAATAANPAAAEKYSYEPTAEPVSRFPRCVLV